MDRKGIILIIVAVAMFGYYWHEEGNYQQAMAKYKLAQQAADAEAQAKAKLEHPEVTAAVETAAQPGANPAANPAPSLPATPDVPEKIETLSTPLVEYSFTNLGGGIARAVLLKHNVGSDSRRGGENHEKVTLNSYGTLPIGAVTDQAGVEAKAAFTATVSPETGEVSFDRTDARQLQITKKFKAPKNADPHAEYVVGLDLTFTNHGEKPLELPGYFIHTGSAGPIHRLDQSLYTGFDWYNGSNTFKSVSTFTAGGILGFGRTEQPVYAQSAANVFWAAVTNQYYCTIITPAAAKGVGVWAQKFSINNVDGTPVAPTASAASQYLGVDGALGMAGFTLPPGQSLSQHFDIFAGPREYGRLEELGGEQEQIMDFGMFKLVSKALLSTMNWLHSLFGSYAAAIIVLTLIIRSLMWPLQNKSTESMKKMQALTPKMNELKAKYPDDPQRMNQELMKLYKNYGVNPLQGCLPMLIQIPIFWGLFRMLPKAVELRNSHFLWVHDLSQPDTVAMIFGYPLNILPLCMAVTMLVQMRLSPKSGDAAQQQILTFMPLIFVFFCYNYASALALYWTVQNVFSIVQLYVTRNKPPPGLQNLGGGGKKKKPRF